MSEYQYYEFQAVDRPLTEAQMRELRAASTRATITPTRFVNEYHWGDLKGDPAQWMGRYFDAFVYFANWGTRRVMLRLPAGLLDPRIAAAAARSPRADQAPAREDLARWIGALPEAEKDRLLAEVAAGEEPQPRAALLRRFREARGAHRTPAEEPRTVAELLAAAPGSRTRRSGESASRPRGKRRHSNAA